MKFSLKKLLDWIGPPSDKAIDREALLMKNVPVKASTLGRIKGGNYVPSERMGNAIMKFISEN